MVTSLPVTDTTGPVTVIDTLTVPVGETERALAHWHHAAEVMADCEGFLSAHAYQATDERTGVQLVTLAQWADESALVRAQEDVQVQEAIGRMVGDPDLHVTHHASLYRAAARITPQTTPGETP